MYLLCYFRKADFLRAPFFRGSPYLIIRDLSMDIKQLECFVRVAELGSFTKAAAMLGMSQSVLSRQVRQLELEIRRHLLHRNGRGVTTTEAGKRLVAHGKGILRQIELARQELHDEGMSSIGKVVIGFPPSVGRLLTVRTVSRFRDNYPSASIGIVEGLTTTMQEWLLLGRLDIAILYHPTPHPNLQYQHAWSEDLYVISPKPADRPLPETIRMAELSRYPLIIPSRPNSIRNMIEADFARHNVELNIALEIDSIPAVIELVAEGMGHAILSRYAIQDHAMRDSLHAARITEPQIASHLVIATSAQRPLSRLAEQTIEVLKSIIGEDSATAQMRFTIAHGATQSPLSKQQENP